MAGLQRAWQEPGAAAAAGLVPGWAFCVKNAHYGGLEE